jgi:hypothetical protein
MALVLKTLCEEAKIIQGLPRLEWNESKPSAAEMALLKKECEADSEFDPLKLRLNSWKDYSSGKYKLKCSECGLAKVISIVPAHIDPPLEDWGRIFQWLGAAPNGKWTIFWIGSSAKREFPARGAPMDSRHVNGGYTIPCSSQGVFIYRIEEATRVLIHELLHAACLDPVEATLPVREATIETWAELFLVAHRAGGDEGRATALWAKQLKWISDTNYKAAKHNNVRGPADYAWRYLNGRAGILRGLGIGLPKPQLPAKASCRFTHPDLD